MGFFDRLSNGWKMGIASLKIIRKNKQLVLFPIISGLALLLVIGSFMGILYSMVGTDFEQLLDGRSKNAYYFSFLYYFICYFIIVFFNVGLVHCTRIYLQGGTPTLSAGFNFAVKRIPVIFGWSVLSATVGLILKAIQENSGTLGQIVAGLIGVVWSVVTFFVVPVLAYEDIGPFKAVKRSGQIMKEKWGESIGASFSFGILSLVGFIIIALPLGLLFSAINPIAGVAVGVLAAFLIYSIVSAAEMVFVASVYHKVVDDKELDDFDSNVIDNLFVKKEDKGIF